MSSLTRPLAGPSLTYDLAAHIDELRTSENYVRSGRVGRTLVKAGPLRVTLVVIREGVDIGTHHAATPMTLHAIEGRLRYRVDDETAELGHGEVLFFGPGHAQDILALEDTALLLTITQEETEE